MIPIQEFKEWLNSLNPENSIAIDYGGLAVVEIGDNRKETGSYFEIGGVPTKGDYEV